MAAVVAVTAYGLLAVLPQPLVAGAEGLVKPAGQSQITDPDVLHQLGGESGPAPTVLTYVDRQPDIVVKQIYNSGAVPLTVTGVQTTLRDGWVGLITIENARAAIIAGPEPCCNLDVAATYSKHDFQAVTIKPGGWGVIAFQILMSNCEHSSSGAYAGVDPVNVTYNMLGFPHVQPVAVGPYWIQTPSRCPRPPAPN